MAVVLPAFPDVENAVCALLETVAPTVTRTPDPLLERLILVRRIGGEQDEHTDYPTVEVQCLALATSTQTAPRDVAQDMGSRANQLLSAAACTAPNGALIDRVDCILGPALMPDENPDLRKVVATYELALRRPRPRRG